MTILDEFIINLRVTGEDAMADLRNMTTITQGLGIQVQEVIQNLGDLNTVMGEPITVSSDIEDITPKDLTLPDIMQQLQEQRDNDPNNVLVDHKPIEIPEQFKRDLNVPIDVIPDVQKLSEVMENIRQNISVLQSSLSQEDHKTTSSFDDINSQVTTILGDLIRQSQIVSQEVSALNETMVDLQDQTPTDTTTEKTSSEVDSFKELVNTQTNQIRDSIKNYSETFHDLKTIASNLQTELKDVSSSIEQHNTEQSLFQSTDTSRRDSTKEQSDISEMVRAVQERVTVESERISDISDEVISNDTGLDRFTAEKTRELVSDASQPSQVRDANQAISESRETTSKVVQESDNIQSMVSNLSEISTMVKEHLQTSREVMDSIHNQDVNAIDDEVYANNLMSEAQKTFSTVGGNIADAPQGQVDQLEEDMVKELIDKMSSLDPGNTFSTDEGRKLLRSDVETLVKQYLERRIRRGRT